MPKDRKQTFSDRQSEASRAKKQQQEKKLLRKESGRPALPTKAAK